MAKDYYKILGVSKEATTKEIAKAYRALALKYHPDKNKNPSNDRFTEINTAYEALKDPKKRAAYDSQYNESIPELETLTEIIIYVTLEGVAFIVSRVKEFVVSTSKSLALKAQTSAFDQYEKLKDKSLQALDKLKEIANKKYDDVKEKGRKLLDQAGHKAHDQYDNLKDKGLKVFGQVKLSVQDKFKNLLSSPDPKTSVSDDLDPKVNEELHSPNHIDHEV